MEYVDFSNLPVGTKSIMFDFGDQTGPNGHGFRRVVEVQAFPTPEPASLVLCGLGAIGLLVAVRRRRA